MPILQPEVEQLPAAELQRLQAARLRDTVARASAVPFYRDALARSGVRADDIRDPADVHRLPFTVKSDLRDQYPFGLLAVSMAEVVRIHASSGTKGKPTVVAYTRHDLDMWAEICARAVATAGGRAGDVFHCAYGYGLFTGGLGMHYGAERLGCAVVPASGGNTARQVLLIADFRPRGLACTPSYALTLADAIEESGSEPRASSIEYGIFGAEPWSQSMRVRLEERLGLRALDIYGLSEVMGPGVSIECAEAQDGLHIAEDHFLVEVVDPQTLQPLPHGEPGELVFTSLTKEAFPVIRYRTGDLAHLYPDPCRCGRTHVRMSRVKARLDDMLVVRGVNVFPSEIELLVLGVPEVAPHYRLIVDRERTLDTVTVEIELAPAFAAAHPGAAAPATTQLAGRVASRLRSQLGISVAVVLQPPGTLPRFEGKAARVVDRRSDSA